MEYVEKVYNNLSGVYDAVFGKFFNLGHVRAPDLLSLSPGDKLLEVGVGTGLTVAEMPRDIEITGIDFSEKMLALAHKRMDKLSRDKVNLIRMDATQLEFADNTFDRVLAAYFVSTLPEPLKVIQEMKRVCKPGGIIVVMNHFNYEVPIISPIERALSPLFYRIGFRTDLRVEPLFEAADLKIERLVKLDWFGHWKAVRCIND